MIRCYLVDGPVNPTGQRMVYTDQDRVYQTLMRDVIVGEDGEYYLLHVGDKEEIPSIFARWNAMRPDGSHPFR